MSEDELGIDIDALIAQRKQIEIDELAFAARLDAAERNSIEAEAEISTVLPLEITPGRPSQGAVTDAQDRPDDGIWSDEAHGLPDHKGFRCGQCAINTGRSVAVAPPGPDYWQSKQIHWQEECDVSFKAFDDSVAEHFPKHDPYNCETCPVKPIMPPKPLAPVERSTRQNAQ